MHASPVLFVFTLLALLTGGSTTYTAEDLDGIWVGNDHTINSRGKSLTRKELKLDVDDDGLISGTTTWTLVTGEGGHDGDTPAPSDSEVIYGAFDANAGTFFLVETEENGFWRGRFDGRDAIRCFLVQPGEKPVAAFVVLERKSP